MSSLGQAMRLALAVLFAVATAAAGSPLAAEPAPALAEAARGLADDLGPPLEGRRALALSVAAGGRLAGPLAAALEAALSARGYAVTPERAEAAEQAEAAARAAGQDWLLRVQADLVPGRRELAVVGELIPTWPSFFLQRRPAARAIPPRLVTGRAAADAETLLLARGARPAGAPFAVVRPLATVEGRVLALAVGETGEAGRPTIAVALPDAVVLLSSRGVALARRALDAAARAPVRAPAATIAIGDFGGGRIAVAHAGAPAGEVLALAAGELAPVAALEAAPLAAGAAGPVFGRFVPGTSVLADAFTARVDPDAPARSERTLYSVAAAPQPGGIAYAALGTDLRLALLDAGLEPVRTPSPPPVTGSAFALADVDGDGSVELVATAPSRAPLDALRVVSLRSGAPLLLEWPAPGGRIDAVASGDLTGDGVDDAVLASSDGEGSSRLWLLTADPREGT